MGIHCTPPRNRFNPQSLVFHLTNSNGYGNLQIKVLLTVSPFRPSFLQPPVLHPENNRFFTPLFSTTSELLFSQLLCFQNHLRCPLVFRCADQTSTPDALSPLPLITSLQTQQLHTITHSFAQRCQAIPPVFNRFRTLSIATGVVPPCTATNGRPMAAKVPVFRVRTRRSARPIFRIRLSLPVQRR
jgi:hypothetical protein